MSIAQSGSNNFANVQYKTDKGEGKRVSVRLLVLGLHSAVYSLLVFFWRSDHVWAAPSHFLLFPEQKFCGF